ncbi:MAG: hypothetical protein D6772_01625 [Bacteroidetes bacterium]|nr:MAG: hypothetical protein D6772_01625 [Bacteroidota bacterium]
MCVACDSSSSHEPQQKAILAPKPPDSLPQKITTYSDTTSRAQANASLAPAPFKEPEALTLPALTKLCLNKYGCLEERIFPLGWSADGKFAYLIEYPNEAVRDYTLSAYVLDATTNRRLDSFQFKASQQDGYEESSDQYNFSSVWAKTEKDIRKLLATHQIIAFNGTELHSLAALGITAQAQDEKEVSMLSGEEILRSHQLVLKSSEHSTRQLPGRTFGKYDLILATEVLGIFQNPLGEQRILLEAQEQRGFEGPPNILQLHLVSF